MAKQRKGFETNMAARHGTRRGYNDGCRCDDCKDAQRLYQRRYRERSLSRVPNPDTCTGPAPGPVEVGVQAEIGSAAEARPGLTQMAFAMARILDNPKAVNQGPAAAKVLTSLLDKLHQAGAPGRRGHLAVVRTMTKRAAPERGPAGGSYIR